MLKALAKLLGTANQSNTSTFDTTSCEISGREYVVLQYVSTTDILADVMTKAIPAVQFEVLQTKLRIWVQPLSSREKGALARIRLVPHLFMRCHLMMTA